MSQPGLSEPLEAALSWLWAFGTAAGLTMLGVLAHGEYADSAGLAATPVLSTDDTGFADDGV